MTMYITVVTTRRVVQVSDRRLTRIQGGRYFLQDDNANKAIIVNNYLGRFSIVYCGLAEVNGIPTAVLMASIFRMLAARSSSPQVYFDQFVDTLGQKFNAISIPPSHRDFLDTDISVAGFLYRGGVFWLRISNCPVDEGNDKRVTRKFSYAGRLVGKPNYHTRRKGTYIEIGGKRSTVPVIPSHPDP